ncbi:hypothetical protein N2152v2_005602 [Parachlorella kessleri]
MALENFTGLHGDGTVPVSHGYVSTPPDSSGNGAVSRSSRRALVHTRFVAETLLPTEHGKFRLRGYRHTTDGGKTFVEPTAIINGVVEGAEELALRVHDACFTSEVLGSLKCDCKEQLQLAMEYLQDNPPGMIIYLQQEGRGIGLANKIAAYALQEKGLDTVDANRALGLPDDCREYSPVGFILQELGVKSVRLMTNNPRKISELSKLGITVTGRIPCLVKAGKYNNGYLKAKQRRMDHMLGSGEMLGVADAEGSSSVDDFQDMDERVPEEELDGSFCWYDHEGEPGSAGIPLEPSLPVVDGAGNIVVSTLPSNQQQSGHGNSGSGS